MTNKATERLLAVLLLSGLAAGMPGAAEVTRQDLLKPEQWLARTQGGLTYDSQLKKVRVTIETIQPLFLSPDLTHTLFVQGRAAYRNDVWTTNVGIGYRFLSPDRTWILGVNAWWDRSWDPDHKRWGLGAELTGSHFTLRGNFYDAYSKWITTATTATTRTEEKALDGFDASIEMPLPYMPWARVSLGYYFWDAESVKNVHGFQGELQVDMTRFTRFTLGITADNQDTSVQAGIRIALGAPAGREFSMIDTGFAATAFPARDVARHVLDPVRRQHDIVVERRVISTVTGGTISVGVGRN